MLPGAIVLAATLLVPGVLAQEQPTLELEFAPPLEGAADPLLAAGNKISSANVEQYAPWLDETVVDSVGAGHFEIELGPQLEFPVHPRYLEATGASLGKTGLLPDGGKLPGYAGGRPFVGLDEEDPQAGLKAAWNMRYTYAPDETETAHFIWRYRDMRKDKLERTIAMYGAILRYTHRHSHEPLPALEDNPANLYSAIYLRVSSPQDIRNTQLLIHRAQDDTEPEQAWMYLNTQRRVKRIATGQKTDAFLGSDIMIEDFLGYNGRIMDMEWTYLGSSEQLLPMYAHNQLDLAQQEMDQDGYRDIAFAGKGHCFPEVTWQLRKVHLLQAQPKDGRHPLSRRHYIIDAVTFTPALTRIYDRTGKLWKLGIVAQSHSAFHTAENEAWQGAATDGVSMVDLQAEHCTTLSLKSRMAAKPLRHKLFNTSYMRQMGR
ncbi:DUF1329 domain-containing protein [Seongchinamella unica]|uniref:DUF1329 domain-containing protein n=1 Tax=Seongchinamella unica TaxID=2547392 RepID=A0A4R5LT38_9GAMM|nr:DUF1329 domain-containing protein [Seongchinamella unica]TDG14060.1 DUF1329 domain-containing protein [Seongchinamella unica]